MILIYVFLLLDFSSALFENFLLINKELKAVESKDVANLTLDGSAPTASVEKGLRMMGVPYAQFFLSVGKVSLDQC